MPPQSKEKCMLQEIIEMTYVLLLQNEDREKEREK
jgi:hypothetical protein